jgi:hypothetical protein
MPERKAPKSGDYMISSGHYPVFCKGIDPLPSPLLPVRFGDQIKAPSLAEIDRRMKAAKAKLDELARQVRAAKAKS